MRQSTSVTSFAALIVVFLQSASAADLPAKAPAPVITPAYNWTGFYIGGNFGGGGNSDRTVSFVPADQAAEGFLFTAGTPGPASFNTIGALGGIQLGYNWQFNRNWLVGFEADFDWSNIKGSASSLGSGFLAPTASFEERVKWFGTVRGRFGFLPVDNFLAYVTGGFAYGRVEHSASYNATALGNGVANAAGTVGVECFGGQHALLDRQVISPRVGRSAADLSTLCGEI